MIWRLSCGFAGRGSGRVLDRGVPVLTVIDPCIWHGCGTNLSRRQSATTAGAPTDQARVCFAALPVSSATLPVQLSLRGLMNIVDHEGMRPGLSRTAGIVTMAVGIAVASWVVFGPPGDWEGGIRWIRHGLALGTLGAISFGARLMFPGTGEDQSSSV